MKLLLPENYNIKEFATIDSTSDEAKRLIESDNATHKLILLAKKQTSGHGRYGRVWESPEGNLYMSLLIQTDKELQKLTQLSFVLAVALGNALSEILPGDRQINYKWPNDILVDGKKIAGILLEVISGWVIIGIGVNIAVTPDLKTPVTSLIDCGKADVTIYKMLEKLINSLNDSLNLWQSSGFARIREAWLSRAWRHGQEITVNLGNETFSGVFAGIRKNGELEIITGEGGRLVSAGEVFYAAGS